MINEKENLKKLKHVIMMTDDHDEVSFDYYDDDDDDDDLIFSSVSLESLYAAELEP